MILAYVLMLAMTTGEVVVKADFTTAAGKVYETEGLSLAFANDARHGKVLEARRPMAGAGRLMLPLRFLKGGEGLQGLQDVTVRVEKATWSMSACGQTDADWPTNECPVAGLGPLSPRTEPDAAPVRGSLQFWSPPDWNAWAGDVALGVYKGRFHVFYLYDRRHHASKCGCGGHQFAHLSSDDLVHWVEHPMSVPVRELWQSVGTGTPFVKDDRLMLSYGWHTERFPWAGAYPRGATWSESEDGIHFKPSGVIFHETRNPTVYNRADGRLGLVCGYQNDKGFFVSDGDMMKWRQTDDTVPFGGDCPCFFEWNGHHYLIQGFTDMAYSPSGCPGTWVNWARSGDDVYDGLSVPMVAEWKGRRLIGGWISHPDGWGGWLAFRELIQFSDGKLGMKWVPEFEKTLPPPKVFKVGAGKNFSCRFTDGNSEIELFVDPATASAGWAPIANGVRGKVWSLAEAKANPDLRKGRGSRFCDPQCAAFYRLDKVRGLDRPYAVRLRLHACEKSDVTIVDAEIAGTRTLLTRHRGRWAMFGDAAGVRSGKF